MGETSAIEWTDATVNFWHGCTKVGPGCDHCYADSFDKRVGGAHWGTGAPRRKIAGAAATLAKLNRMGGKRVFIQSMSDLFDNEVPAEWFAHAWWRIFEAKSCRIQLVTKRISMVEKRLEQIGAVKFGWPAHAGLMITVVNQAEADRDIPRLLALKAKLGIPWVGLSMEPLLGPVDLTAIRPTSETPWDEESADLNEWGVMNALAKGPWPTLDWVIVGGESGPKARPMHPDWARSLRDQCQAAGVPFFFKQWGEWLPGEGDGKAPAQWQDGKQGGREDSREWRHFGEPGTPGAFASRVGKARAGRLLDGRECNDMAGTLTHA